MLRERIEDAAPEERAALRALWERLVSHPRERVLLALGAHPRAGGAAPVAPRHVPDLAAVAAIVATVTPPDELLVLPLASTAVTPPPADDPLAALAAELGEER